MMDDILVYMYLTKIYLQTMHVTNVSPRLILLDGKNGSTVTFEVEVGSSSISRTFIC